MEDNLPLAGSDPTSAGPARLIWMPLSRELSSRFTRLLNNSLRCRRPDMGVCRRICRFKASTFSVRPADTSTRAGRTGCAGVLANIAAPVHSITRPFSPSGWRASRLGWWCQPISAERESRWAFTRCRLHRGLLCRQSPHSRDGISLCRRNGSDPPSSARALLRDRAWLSVQRFQHALSAYASGEIPHTVRNASLKTTSISPSCSAASNVQSSTPQSSIALTSALCGSPGSSRTGM